MFHSLRWLPVLSLLLAGLGCTTGEILGGRMDFGDAEVTSQIDEAGDIHTSLTGRNPAGQDPIEISMIWHLATNTFEVRIAAFEPVSFPNHYQGATADGMNLAAYAVYQGRPPIFEPRTPARKSGRIAYPFRRRASSTKSLGSLRSRMSACSSA